SPAARGRGTGTGGFGRRALVERQEVRRGIHQDAARCRRTAQEVRQSAGRGRVSNGRACYFIAIALTCSKVVRPPRAFRIPSCISVIMPSFFAKLVMSAFFARF